MRTTCMQVQHTGDGCPGEGLSPPPAPIHTVNQCLCVLQASPQPPAVPPAHKLRYLTEQGVLLPPPGSCVSFQHVSADLNKKCKQTVYTGWHHRPAIPSTVATCVSVQPPALYMHHVVNHSVYALMASCEGATSMVAAQHAW